MHLHFRGESQVDLTARITAAWARGVRGSLDPEELFDVLGEGEKPLAGDTPENGFPRRERKAAVRQLRPLRVLAAAAGLLAALGAAWWWVRSAGPSTQPLAVATHAVLLLRGAEGTAERGTTLEPGDSLVVAEVPVELAFASGAVLRIDPVGVLALGLAGPGEPDVILALGAVDLRGAGADFVLRTDFSSLRIPPDAAVVAAVVLEEPDVVARLSPAELGRRLLDAGFDAPRLFTVRVIAGEVELVHAAASEMLTAASGPITLWSRPAPSALTRRQAAELERFDALFEQICVERAELPMKQLWGGYAESSLAMEGLSELLADAPPLRSRLRERVHHLRAAPQTPNGFTACVLDFLVQDPADDSLRLARELWLESPDDFREIHVVGFAERGAFEFQRELRAAVGAFEPADAEDDRPVLAAVYLAVRGDDLGRAQLEEALDPASGIAWTSPNYFLAALALDALGEPGAWSDVQSRVRERVEALLEESELVAAADLLLAFEAFHRLREADELPPLAGMVQHVRRHIDRRKPEVQREEHIRALLAELVG